MYLVFDCETTGLYEKGQPPPRLVQLAWQLHDRKGNLLQSDAYIVQPEGFDIPFAAEKMHGISTERAQKEGRPLLEVLQHFDAPLERATCLVGHNLEYDLRILEDEYKVLKKHSRLRELPVRDTMQESCEYVALPGGKNKGYKYPKLTELYEKIFGHVFSSTHNAAYDVAATAACFFSLLQRDVLRSEDSVLAEEIAYELPSFFKDSEAAGASSAEEKASSSSSAAEVSSSKALSDATGAYTRLPFAHTHLHSQLSIVPATLSVQDIVDLAEKHSMPAVALTDMGNLCGAFSFVKAARKANILPIVGCEYFVSEQREQFKFTKANPDRMYRQPLLAKNKTGYRNLCTLSTLGYLEGLYGIYPRIDKALISAHREGVVALSGGPSAELPRLIVKQGPKQAEKALHYWIDTFGDDFYVEIQRHGSEAEARVNEVLLDWAQRYKLSILPVQEIFYAEEGADTHDTLICIKEQLLKSSPIGEGRGRRPPLVEEKHHFCSAANMHARFSDLPEAFEHLSGLIKKIQPYELSQKCELPAPTLPKDFSNEADYLRHIAYEGAKRKYKTLTREVKERLEHELKVMRDAGYSSYFLIVHEIVSQAKKMNVEVGPGRGSAVGSLIAYVLDITQIDPLAYGLFFERFLNVDRISMPDVDIDFGDERRDDIIQWVLERYGKDRVAQISTHGTMAARASIRDCARVMEMKLEESDRLAKSISGKSSLKEALTKNSSLRDIRESETLAGKVLAQAEVIEGMVRNIGTHACGIIISSKPLIEMVPLMHTKGAKLTVTQYDNNVVEEAGLLKIDLLAIKTLSVIRSTLQQIKARRDLEIDLASIPLDDSKTYALYQQGQTVGTFQFESSGMRRCLQALKPDCFEDLIAMIALYRPGPMEYIDSFIRRKHGKEKISYDLAEMEKVLSMTYGITVYQEQVMQLSELLAGFSKSEADTLRYAMGKKSRSLLDALKPKFLEGFKEREYPEKLGEKIWKDWEAFAGYAFNRSHATCYALLAYQTTYLRANFPEEYMASVLTYNQGSTEKIPVFIEECRSVGLQVLPPDVNTSEVFFSVHKAQIISFGLAAVKGVGQAAAEAICSERKSNGVYKNIFDFAARLLRNKQSSRSNSSSSDTVDQQADTSSVRAQPEKGFSKKTCEALAQAAAFDKLADGHRRQYLEAPKGEKNGIEKALKWAQHLRSTYSSTQELLFSGANSPSPSTLPSLPPYSAQELLDMEKEAVGVFISGHPLDNLRPILPSLTNLRLHDLSDLTQLSPHRNYRLMGQVKEYKRLKSRNNTEYAHLLLEDFSSGYRFSLFGSTYERYKNHIQPKSKLYITGKVKERKYDQDTRFFDIEHVSTLPEGLSELLSGLSVRISASDLNKDTQDQLEALLQRATRGRCPLRLQLQENGMLATFRVKKYIVSPDLSLLSELSKLKNIHLDLALRT